MTFPARHLLGIVILAVFCAPAMSDSDPEPIPLIGGVFTPRKGTVDLDGGPTVTDSVYSGHAFVQLDSALTQDVERRLARSGVVLLGHVHGRTFLARVNAPRSKLRKVISRVGAAIARVPASTKQDPGTARWAAAKPRNSYLIRVHPDVSPSEADATFHRLAIAARPSRRCDCWEVNLVTAELAQLAELDVVRRIEPNDFDIKPFTHEIRNATGVDAIQGFTGSATTYGFGGTSGAGVTIGILDVGVASADHHAYRDVGATGVLDAHSRYTAYDPQVHLHAAWMAGIIGGNGVDTPASSGADWNLHGLAPKSTLFGMMVVGSEYAIFKEALADHGADITNNSYGDTPENGVSLALDDDAIIWGSATYGGVTIPPRPAVWAVGNSGTNPTSISSHDNGYFSVHNPQKNGIIVGGSVIDRSTSPMTSQKRWEGSSLGPTFDGRLKPELLAPACKTPAGILDELVQTTNLVNGTYSAPSAYGPVGECGTSFSAAAVTGIASLLLEDWRSVHDSWSRPLPATLKAVLIQGAQDVTAESQGPVLPDASGRRVSIGALDGPDYATGYGEVDASASHAIVMEQRVVEDQILDMSHSHVYRVTVPANSPRLRVTLAWDDPPEAGTAPTAQKLENDLDLTVTGPLESKPETRLPWGLPTWTPPATYDPTWVPSDLRVMARSVDRRNNVEQVQFLTPRPGTYEITIKPYVLSFAYPQPFAVAADFPISTAVDSEIFTGHDDRVSFSGILGSPKLAELLANAKGKNRIVIPTNFSCSERFPCATCERWGVCEARPVILTGVPREWTVGLVDQRGRSVRTTRNDSGAQVRLTLPRKSGLTTFLVLQPPDGAKAPPQVHDRIQLIPAQ